MRRRHKELVETCIMGLFKLLVRNFHFLLSLPFFGGGVCSTSGPELQLDTCSAHPAGSGHLWGRVLQLWLGLCSHFEHANDEELWGGSPWPLASPLLSCYAADHLFPSPLQFYLNPAEEGWGGGKLSVAGSFSLLLPL